MPRLFVCPTVTFADLHSFAGRAGVTPMRAMLPTFQNTGVDVVLVYSVRTPAEAAFRAEFHEAAAAGGVRVVYTVTSAFSAKHAGYGRDVLLSVSRVLRGHGHQCMLLKLAVDSPCTLPLPVPLRRGAAVTLRTPHASGSANCGHAVWGDNALSCIVC